MDGTAVKFDLAELFRQSWEVYKKNLGPLLGAVVVIWFILGLGNVVLNLILRIGAAVAFLIAGPLGAGLFLIVAYGFTVGLTLLIAGPLALGLFKMVRQALKDESVDINLLFSGFSHFPDAYLAGLLIGLFSVIGSVFCIIPGVIVKFCYASTYLFMNERKLAFWDAMEASRKMAMNNPGQWVILALALFVLNLATVVTCGLALLVTVPMTYIIIAMAYDLEQNAVIDVASAPVTPAEPPSA